MPNDNGYWNCPVHDKKLTKLPLPSDYEGPTSHLEVYFCSDCKKGYSLLELLGHCITIGCRKQ